MSSFCESFHAGEVMPAAGRSLAALCVFLGTHSSQTQQCVITPLARSVSSSSFPSPLRLFPIPSSCFSSFSYPRAAIPYFYYYLTRAKRAILLNGVKDVFYFCMPFESGALIPGRCVLCHIPGFEGVPLWQGCSRLTPRPATPRPAPQHSTPNDVELFSKQQHPQNPTV